MTPQVKRALLFAGGFVSLVALIVIVDRAEDIIHISYQFDVWRMDLDDALSNIGIFLAGLAAFVALFRKADKAHKKADQVSERINGGMAEMAKQHVELATQEAQEAGRYIDLLSRIIDIEKQRDICREDLADLREWVFHRLDESGNGRETKR